MQPAKTSTNIDQIGFVKY